MSVSALRLRGTVAPERVIDVPSIRGGMAVYRGFWHELRVPTGRKCRCPYHGGTSERECRPLLCSFGRACKKPISKADLSKNLGQKKISGQLNTVVRRSRWRLCFERHGTGVTPAACAAASCNTASSRCGVDGGGAAFMPQEFSCGGQVNTVHDTL